ncbi:translocation/assembly module TamB domain-containing protein [Staphylococcus epidermidis]|nr:translocation/assembly module TamB domain-containing protein [Staphylococcus epidermidis]
MASRHDCKGSEVRGASYAGGPPSITGEIRTVEGRYRAWGQSLNVETGLIRFNGPYNNPSWTFWLCVPTSPSRPVCRCWEQPARRVCFCIPTLSCRMQKSCPGSSWAAILLQAVPAVHFCSKRLWHFWPAATAAAARLPAAWGWMKWASREAVMATPKRP